MRQKCPGYFMPVLNKLAHADFGGQAEQMARLENQIAEQSRAQRNRTIGVLLIVFALLPGLIDQEWINESTLQIILVIIGGWLIVRK